MEGSDPGTFGKEAVPDGDPVGGVRGCGGASRPPAVVSLQLTGQCQHGCSALICLLAHVAPRCAAPLLLWLTTTKTAKDKDIMLCWEEREKTLTDTSKTHEQIHLEQFQKHKWEHFVEHLWNHNCKLPSGYWKAPAAQRPRSLLCLIISSQRKCKSQRGAFRYKCHLQVGAASCHYQIMFQTLSLTAGGREIQLYFLLCQHPDSTASSPTTCAPSGLSPWQGS